MGSVKSGSRIQIVKLMKEQRGFLLLCIFLLEGSLLKAILKIL